MSSNKMDEQEERWGKRNKEKMRFSNCMNAMRSNFDQGLVKRTVN